MNLREKILSTEDIPSREVFVPNWNVTILVKGLSAGERIDLTQAAVDQVTGSVNLSTVYPDIVVSCCFDPETGEPIFQESDKQDIMKKSSKAIEMLASAGLELSGIGEGSADEAGKDSSSDLKEDSSSS
jgi:hypothetical protein